MKINAKTVYDFIPYVSIDRFKQLEYIKIDNDGIVATDSHKLLFKEKKSNLKNPQYIKAKEFCEVFKKVDKEVETETKENINFPDWEQVIPKGDPCFSIKLNPKILIECTNTFKNEKFINMEFYGEEKPVKITKGDNDFIILMPLKK